MNEIIPNLYLGGSQQMTSTCDVKDNDLIINCTRDITYKTTANFIRIEVEDDCSKKAIDTMKKSFVSVVKQIENVLSRGHKVFVHCKMGQQRSCAVIAAYLMKTRCLTVDQVIKLVKTKKKDAFFWQANFKDSLQWWFEFLQSKNYAI